MAQTFRWSAVGLPILAIVSVGASIVSPLSATIAGPTLLIASASVLRRAPPSGLRGIALATAAIGAGLCVLVVVVGLVLVAV